ncbi:TolA protein [Cronobacter condimenti 1330]|uniref:TolA protein n=1 Tax=Cronobacter condimenti 1330 TaxID=1073999 RepID=K8A950_9ENTR|nr:cell envelope integrity protein TolA [Cronobacter condimenti]ALB62471.1 hypothetical protein AFK62_08120 [Cronobacter condimenti 1330]CCJ72294.1 TolA protein [Cronobacter condimenti 1330]
MKIDYWGMKKKGTGLLFASLLSGGCVQHPPVNAEVDKLFEDYKMNSASETPKESYALQLYHAINAHLDEKRFPGKQCSVKIKMAPDGLLLDARVTAGDPDFCHEVLNAMAKARLPKPPTPEAYQQFKNATLDFNA